MTDGHGRTSPAWLAKAAWDRLETDWTFAQIVEMHMLYGWVVSTPQYFILARPVDRCASEAEILDPVKVFEQPNAWFVWLMAGRVDFAWQYYPIPYRWVGWQRGDRPITWWKMDRVRGKICQAED